MGEGTGRSFVVENRVGAGGTLGAAAVARAAPDGTTLLVSELGANAAAPAVFANLPYDPVRDFAHLLIAAEVPVVLVGHPGAAPDLAGMIAAARATPGRLTYASGGVGNASHLFMADFLRRAALKMTHVPYRGGGDIIRALLAGETGFSVTTVATALPLVRSGGLRALGVGDVAPHPLLPDVPPLAAAVPGFGAAAWHGLHAPAATPRPVLAALHGAAAEAVADPALRAWMTERGIAPRGGTPDEAAAFIAAETTRWTEAAREAGVRPD
jgi:tripartite-type tricarboxylate transporter receptor subunit TctC